MEQTPPPSNKFSEFCSEATTAIGAVVIVATNIIVFIGGMALSIKFGVFSYAFEIWGKGGNDYAALGFLISTIGVAVPFLIAIVITDIGILLLTYINNKCSSSKNQ